MKKPNLVTDTEPELTAAKMVNKIAFVGVTRPEILAEGFCPNCITMVDLWVTGQGLELSLHGRGYTVEPPIEMDNEEKRAYQPKAKYSSGSKPTTIEDPLFHKEEISLISKMSDFLFMPISCQINLKSTIFFVLLSFASIALLIQGLYYFWPANEEIQLISLNTNWAVIIRNLFLVLLSLIAINFVSYKAGFSDSGPDQIDKWTLGSSIVAFSYCLLNSIILPLLFISHLNLAL
ncbi:MAG: hypothetical protein ABFC94_15045 [Syntrophomonas sp.]